MLAQGRPGTRYGADVAYTAAWLCDWDIACVHEPLLHFSFVPKDAAAYAAASSSTEPVPMRPFSQMLGDIGQNVRRKLSDEAYAMRMIRALARTLAFENPSLSAVVMQENGAQPALVDDADRLDLFLRLFSETI
jgi:hypothetical protein